MMDFTIQQLIDEAITLARDNPDTTQRGACFYAERGDKPGCLFGQAMSRLGATQEELKALDDDAISSNIGNIVTLELGLTSSSVASLLESAQEAQDTGSPWGTGPLEYLLAARGAL